MAARWEVTVAIDFGTTGTLMAITFPDDPEKKIADLIKGCTPIKPGDLADAISGDKQPTVLLLDEAEPHILLHFGNAARKAFAGEGTGAASARGLFYKNFKTSLFSGDQRNLEAMMIEPSTEFAVETRLANAPGAGGATIADAAHPPSSKAVPAMTLFQRTLEYCKAEAMSYLASRMRLSGDKGSKLAIKWVVTCPSIWTEEGKSFMRTAAFKAGLIDHPTSNLLTLCLEPEAAILASIADCVPTALGAGSAAGNGGDKKAAAEGGDGDASPAEGGGLFKKGTTILVADCGGGTIDYCIQEVVTAPEPGPLALKEIATPDGGPWGAVNVDVNFVDFLQELLGEANYKALPDHAKLDLISLWEKDKLTVDGVHKNSDTITLKVDGVIDALEEVLEDGFDKGDMEDLVEAYNKKHRAFFGKLKAEHDAAHAGSGGKKDARAGGGGGGGDDDDDESSDDDDEWEPLEFKPRLKKLALSPVVVRHLFNPVINKILDHTAKLIEERLPRKIDVVLLAGGFSESPMLKLAMKKRFENEDTAVIVPRRPGQVVVLGAALYAHRPATVTERVVRYSWGYLTVEAYNPAVHEECHKKVGPTGKPNVAILLPAVQKGAIVKVGQVWSKTLRPSRSDQKDMEFRLFRVPELIHDPFTSNKRTVVVRKRNYGVSFTHADTREVTEAEKACKLRIHIGGRGQPVAQREVRLDISFGEAEIEAKATSMITGKVKRLEVTYGARGEAGGLAFGARLPKAIDRDDYDSDTDDDDDDDDDDDEEEGERAGSSGKTGAAGRQAEKKR